MSCTSSVSVQLYETQDLQDSAPLHLWVLSRVRRPEMEKAAAELPSVPTWIVSMLAKAPAQPRSNNVNSFTPAKLTSPSEVLLQVLRSNPTRH